MMAIGPNYSNAPLLGGGQVTPALTGTKTVPTNATLRATFAQGAVATAGMLNSVQAVATGVTTAGNLLFWLYDGTTYYLIKEILVTAATPSASVAVFDSGVVTFGPNGAGYPV